MNGPAISIIVPIYNSEKYLGRCIDSILSQSFTDFELILVDDGSKDSTHQHQEDRVAYRGKENKGDSQEERWSKLG